MKRLLILAAFIMSAHIVANDFSTLVPSYTPETGASSELGYKTNTTGGMDYLAPESAGIGYETGAQGGMGYEAPAQTGTQGGMGYEVTDDFMINNTLDL